MTNIDTSVSDIVTMIEYDNALVSIVVPMINPMMIQTVVRAVCDAGMVMEMTLLSDPVECRVRLQNAI